MMVVVCLFVCSGYHYNYYSVGWSIFNVVLYMYSYCCC